MSKIEAIRCDYCGQIVEKSDTFGISGVQDMFDKLESYKSVTNPDKAEIHCCVEHYASLVLRAAEAQVDRKRDEPLYRVKVRELAYMLRSTTVERYRKNTVDKKKSRK